MRMTLTFFVTAVLLTSPVWGKDEVKEALKKLQGTWIVQQLDIPDEGPRKDFEKHGRLVIKGNKATFFRAEQKFAQFTLKLDPTRSPKAVDLKIDYLPTKKGEKDKAVGKLVPGIYELKGDTLKCCYAPPGGARPTEFSAKAGSGLYVAVYRRLETKK